jgi:hypothetical protein
LTASAGEKPEFRNWKPQISQIRRSRVSALGV